MSENLTLAVARYATSTSTEELPSEVKERAKKVIVDEIACAYFGRRSLAGDLAARYAEQAGGHAQARIYATASASLHLTPRSPTAPRAWRGGRWRHVVGGHPGASVVHAAVAMAERQRATGADLLNAVVLGYDVGCARWKLAAVCSRSKIDSA